MIADQDRSGWFGASDTAMIMGNWKTKTFQKWWLQKLGVDRSRFTSRAMNAGTYYEHSILDTIGVPRKDHQILLPQFRLRVNLDGDGPGEIHEVKTHKADKVFKVTKAYWQQVQVQGFAKFYEEQKRTVIKIHSYGLEDADYKNFFREIDPNRLKEHPIEYDPVFIGQYLPRLMVLADCLERGEFPRESTE